MNYLKLLLLLLLVSLSGGTVASAYYSDPDIIETATNPSGLEYVRYDNSKFNITLTEGNPKAFYPGDATIPVAFFTFTGSKSTQNIPALNFSVALKRGIKLADVFSAWYLEDANKKIIATVSNSEMKKQKVRYVTSSYWKDYGIYYINFTFPDIAVPVGKKLELSVVPAFSNKLGSVKKVSSGGNMGWFDLHQNSITARNTSSPWIIIGDQNNSIGPISFFFDNKPRQSLSVAESSAVVSGSVTSSNEIELRETLSSIQQQLNFLLKQKAALAAGTTYQK